MREENRNFERRFYPRFNSVLQVKISGADFHLAAETKNISCSGLYCKAGRFIPVMTKLALTMFVPLIIRGKKVEKELNCTAVVVRIEPEYEQNNVNDYHLGLFFTQINKKDRRIISKYIKQAFFVNNN